MEDPNSETQTKEVAGQNSQQEEHGIKQNVQEKQDYYLSPVDIEDENIEMHVNAASASRHEQDPDLEKTNVQTQATEVARHYSQQEEPEINHNEQEEHYYYLNTC